mmetsp:Transcript_20075/g.76970  ORF Transcript_20075/g.76970 Transcript_20075/m.76970 type:complete len:103 (-) Transcript_20075:852-1160(-)
MVAGSTGQAGREGVAVAPAAAVALVRTPSLSVRLQHSKSDAPSQHGYRVAGPNFGKSGRRLAAPPRPSALLTDAGVCAARRCFSQQAGPAALACGLSRLHQN